MPKPKVVPCFNWQDANIPPKAVILCLHGLGLHGGAFKGFGEQMARQGIATYALDMRGFGRWNDKGETSLLSFPDCLGDVEAKIAEIERLLPGLPIFLLGESLGGAVAIHYAAQNQTSSVKGLILSAPARLDTNHHRELMRVTWRIICERKTALCIEEHILRYAPNVVQFRNGEIPVRWQFSVGELLHTVKFLVASYKMVDRITSQSVLIVQGHADPLITTKTTMDIFERIATRDKRLVILGDAEHLIFQLPIVTPSAVAMVRDWIEERIDFKDQRTDFGGLKRVS